MSGETGCPCNAENIFNVPTIRMNNVLRNLHIVILTAGWYWGPSFSRKPEVEVDRFPGKPDIKVNWLRGRLEVEADRFRKRRRRVGSGILVPEAGARLSVRKERKERGGGKKRAKEGVGGWLAAWSFYSQVRPNDDPVKLCACQEHESVTRVDTAGQFKAGGSVWQVVDIESRACKRPWRINVLYAFTPWKARLSALKLSAALSPLLP